MTNDKEIYKEFDTDKEKGFRLLMNTYQKPVYFFIRRMVVDHDDAEDIMQETFISMYRTFDRFRQECALQTWLFKIASNECLRFLHRQKIEQTDLQEELATKLMASEYVDYENEMAVKFQNAIISLPEKQRLVFNLRYYDELEYSEISKITDTKVETLKVNYHYAKENIKKYILNR
jgi:RNA polymerase sigma-70 factor (ECF subfamily)